MKRVNVSLGDELYKKVERRSAETGASMSSILALAYEQYEMQQSMVNQMPGLLEAMKMMDVMQKVNFEKE